MRFFIGLVSLATLSVAACTTTMPDSRSPAGLSPKAQPATGAPLSAMIEGGSVQSQPISEGQAAPRPAGISDEQDFSAVSSRESIESDAARRQGFQAAYAPAQAVAVPDRPRGSSVSIVKYALSTSNAVGQPVHARSSLSGAARAQRNCAKYTSADFAQIAFLEAGGPKRDKMGLDPDGDGFACAWNPAPFRAARAGAPQTPVVEDSGVSAADLQALGIEATPTAAPETVLPGDTMNVSGE